MTPAEIAIAKSLLRCTFLPGSFDKRFVRQLPGWFDRPMTEKGRALMVKLLYKYRRQIPRYAELNEQLSAKTPFHMDPNDYDIQYNLFGGFDLIKRKSA